jgi:hypothetical protein
MKTPVVRACLAFLAVLLAFSSLALTPAATSASVTLLPKSYTTQSGGSGGQPVSAMWVKDQSGAQDDWNAYVEFTTPGKSAYSGLHVFTLPAGVAPKAISSIRLKVNFRGPLHGVQTWSWSIYNWSAAAWVKVGSSVTAGDWVWTSMAFNVPAPYARYVSAGRALRLRLQSNNAAGDADIDYESLQVGYGKTPVTPTPTPVTWWKPGLTTSWQIQYSGTIDTGLDVQVYNLDGFETSAATVKALHARGIRVMCYFSAGSWENWRPDAAKFPVSVRGKALDGWPGENWLDIRQRSVLLPLMKARMELCKTKGFDGLDPDNVNGYENDSGFPLSAADQLAYNRALATAAHARGLAIGLKNDIDQIPSLVSAFDWELNEQCFEYQECDKLLPFIQAGKPVFNIEYSLATTAFCPQANALNFNSLKKNLALGAYREACR